MYSIKLCPEGGGTIGNSVISAHIERQQYYDIVNVDIGKKRHVLIHNNSDDILVRYTIVHLGVRERVRNVFRRTIQYDYYLYTTKW